jgi:glycosyltransferase involved in cell wall biosynthesis
LESIGFGTPTLISEQSGVKEVLKNTLKVDFWDVDEMANQITAVVQNDALRDTLQTNAKAELNKMSWDHTAEKLFGIYHYHVHGAPA